MWWRDCNPAQFNTAPMHIFGGRSVIRPDDFTRPASVEKPPVAQLVIFLRHVAQLAPDVPAIAVQFENNGEAGTFGFWCR